MHNQEKTEKVLEDEGALLKGHFVYVSGKHGEEFIDADKALEKPTVAYELGRYFAQLYKYSLVDVVAGLERGGAKFAQWVGYHLSILSRQKIIVIPVEKETQMISLHAERVNGTIEYLTGRFVISSNNAHHLNGKRVLLVDDIFNTGKTVGQGRDEILGAGGKIVGCGAIWNRGGLTREDLLLSSETCFESLINRRVAAWRPDECKKCAEGVLINTEVGHGKDFLAQR